MTKKWTGFLEGFIWIGCGAFFSVLALHFEFGSFRAPGAGFLAFLTGIFVGGLGVILVISKALRARREGEVPNPSSEFSLGAHGRIVYTLALLIMYAVLMDRLGFVLATTLAMFGLFFDPIRRNWLWSSLFSVTTTLSSYVVFEIWLRCQLPRGVFPWW